MWRVGAKVAASAVLIWFVLRGRDVGALLDSVSAVRWWALTLAVGLLGAFTVLLALRWSDILAVIGHALPFRLLFAIVLIGQFFNQALPSAVGGDAMRIWLILRAGVPAMAAVSSTLVDRLFGILAILILATAGLPALLALPLDAKIVHGVIALICLGYLGFAVALLLDRLPAVVRRIKVIAFIAQVSADLRAVLLSWRAVWRPLACSIAIQFGIVIVVFVLARGLDFRIDLPSCLIVVPLSSLVLALPISIGGWGVRENFFVLAFQTVGVPAAHSLALSVLYGLLTILVGLPGGLVWLARRERNVAAVAAAPQVAQSIEQS
jgi:glycosyltransferase 2 family protein